MRRKKRKEGKRKRGNDCDKGHCFSLGRKGYNGEGWPESFKLSSKGREGQQRKESNERKATKGVMKTGK